MAKRSTKKDNAGLTPVQAAFLSWAAVLLFGIVGLWAVFLAPVDEPLTSPSWKPPTLLLWAAWFLAFTISIVAAGASTWRYLRALRCRWNPAYEDRLVANLDSSSLFRVRWSLQTLLDVRGRPFGEVDVTVSDEEQLRMLVALYRAWWECPETTAPDQFALKARQMRDRLLPAYLDLIRPTENEEEKPQRDPGLEGLPPVDTRWLIEVTQPRFVGTMETVAAAINRATNRGDVMECAKEAQELFVALAAQALEEAWRKRFDAAEQRQPNGPRRI